VVEEIKLHGHNRHDITNTLKPLITNDIVEIHAKGKDPRNVPNTVNYLLLTNYVDAVPIGAGDRRYFVCFSRLPQELVNNAEYFDPLFQGIKEHPGALGRWLLDLDWHEEFYSQGRAPWTAAKESAVEASKHELQAVVEEALAESTSPLFGEEVVLFQPLLDYLEVSGAGGEDLTKNVLSRVLADLGFQFLGRRRIYGYRHRIYTRRLDGERATKEWAMEVIETRELTGGSA